MWHRGAAHASRPSQPFSGIYCQRRTQACGKWGSIRSTQKDSHRPARLGELGLLFCISVSQSFQPQCHPESQSQSEAQKMMWKSPCRRPLCTFHLWRSSDHSLLGEVYCLGTIQTCSFFDLHNLTLFQFWGSAHSFLQEERSPKRWLLGSVILSSEYVNEIQSTHRLASDAPLPTVEPHKPLWNCSKSRNYISSLPNSLECRLFPSVIMWLTRTAVQCCLIWDKSPMQIYHCFVFPVYGVYVSVHVFLCVCGCQRLMLLIMSPSYILKEGLSLGLITGYVASHVANLFQGSRALGLQAGFRLPTFIWVSRKWTQVLTLVLMKSSLPTESIPQLKNYAGMLLFMSS